jgi:V8-like Glu-specific endopeptidase
MGGRGSNRAARRRAGLAAALVAAAASFAGAAAANIFVADDRMPVERMPGTPWAAVGLITQAPEAPPGQIRFGTATLVGPCHALTAHHTSFSSAVGASPEERSVLWFGPESDDGFPWSFRTTGRPAAWGDLGDHVHADWALLELDDCLGRDLGWWDLAPMDFATARDLGATGLMSVGHPAAADRRTALLDPGCGVYAEAGRLPGWETDCAVRVGNSGGPVFVAFDPAEPPPRPQLVAIVKGDFFPQGEGVVIPQWDSRAANIALPIYAFSDRLAPHLEAGRRRAAQERASATTLR